jgi:hypothetical protein
MKTQRPAVEPEPGGHHVVGDAGLAKELQGRGLDRHCGTLARGRSSYGWLDDLLNLSRKTTITRADAPASRAVIPAK